MPDKVLVDTALIRNRSSGVILSCRGCGWRRRRGVAGRRLGCAWEEHAPNHPNWSASFPGSLEVEIEPLGCAVSAAGDYVRGNPGRLQPRATTRQLAKHIFDTVGLAGCREIKVGMLRHTDVMENLAPGLKAISNRPKASPKHAVVFARLQKLME